MDVGLYSYGAEGVDDSGWGCVFRSFQNAQAACGYNATPISDLVEGVGRGWGAWAEPADFVDAVPSLAFLAGASPHWLKYTKRKQYSVATLPTVAALEDLIKLEGGYSAFVVDDGISGYAIVPFHGKPYWVDPHTTAPRRAQFRQQLRRSSGWMVLQIFPKTI
jgi:hypothetical protein